MSELADRAEFVVMPQITRIVISFFGIVGREEKVG